VEIVRVLRAGPTAPAEARGSLVALNGCVRPDRLDDLRLVVSELVTNSILHAGLDQGEPIIVKVEVSSESARVEVVDCGPGFAKPSSAPGPHRGWGLPLVERVADRWGLERGSETKVWAELPLRP
jgi:anti-sigma regulatory factor (Ser/Thr protein kinase)